MVVCGAGISVSAGVPDFRSAGGVYQIVRQMGLPVSEPQELFDIACFDDDPETFYKFAHVLWPSSTIRPTPTHRFFQLLESQGKLLRCYTQNIDGLERAAGLSRERTVECHGSLATSSCRSCGDACNSVHLAGAVVDQRVPLCKKCGGVMKPDVTVSPPSLFISFLSASEI